MAGMPVMGMLSQVLASLGSQLPLLAVWAIGALLALAFWKRDPRGALMVLLACLICLCTDFGFTVIYAVVPQYLHGPEIAGMGIRTAFMILGFVRSCVIAVAWTLLLVAVLRRNPAG